MSGRCLDSQHCCFGSANRDDSFNGKTFDVSYSTFLISIENQTQVCHLGSGFRLYGKDCPLTQGYSPCHVTDFTNLVRLIAKELQHSIHW